MFKKLKTITNKLLALGIIVAVLIVVLVGLDIYQKAKQKEGLSDNNLLQAPKEKIVDYEVKPQGNDSKVVIYRYVSTQPVPAQTYQGLKEDLAKRTPNSQTFLKSITLTNEQTQRKEYVSKFYSSPTWQKEGNIWYQIETATTTPVAFISQTKLTILDQIKEFLGQKVLADTSTFYSGAGDGEVSYEESVSDDWNIVHNAATGGSALPISTTARALTSHDDPTDTYEIAKIFLPFNTSSIIASASITSASLSVYISTITNGNNNGKDYINVVRTTQPSSTTFTTADYDLVGPTHLPPTGATAIDLTAGFTALAYNTFTLNATGLTWVAKSGVTSVCGTTTGVTCLGLREGHDIEDFNPWPTTYQNGITISTSEATGTSQDPYLTVTYTTVAPDVIKINGGKVKINGGTIKVD